METIAVSVRVTGRVQGVGFRNAMKEAADRLGLVGWVRNRGDGTVEAHAVGSSEAVEGLLAWCATGSPMAQVGNIHTAVLQDAPHYSAFLTL